MFERKITIGGGAKKVRILIGNYNFGCNVFCALHLGNFRSNGGFRLDTI